MHEFCAGSGSGASRVRDQPHDPFNIRPYHAADLERIALLYTASVHALAAPHYDAAQRDAWAPRPPDLDQWRQRLAAVRTLVAEEGGEPAGFISFAEDGYIDLLFTSPSHARRGVASELYRHVETLLKSSGIEEASTHASLAARPFFESHGFMVTEAQEVSRGGVALRRFAMRKRIS